MPKKLLGYSLVSFFSFWFFLALFITGVYAQMPEIQPSVPPPISDPSSASTKTADTTSDNPQPDIYLVPGDTSSGTDPQTQKTYEPGIMPQPTIYLIPLDSPAAALKPVPSIVAPGDLDALFTKYSAEYQVDKAELLKIARCESNFHTQSVNGIYLGMFQFSGSTWVSVRTAMGLDPNIDLRTNAEESIRTAAYWISAGHLSAWSCR